MSDKIQHLKAEISRIHAEESQLIRDMERQRKQKQEEEAKGEARQLTEWRARQEIGMKQGLEERSNEMRTRQLHNSKDFLLFKREVKTAMREKEQELRREQLANNLEHARFRHNQQLAVAAGDKRVLADRMNTRQELRDLKLAEAMQQKERAQQERIDNMRMELDFEVKQIVAEREKAMRNLQFSESTHKHIPLARRR